MASEQVIENGTKPKGGIGEFIGETRREISKVTWPTRADIGMTTVMIVVLAIVAGIFFLMVDTALGYVVSHLLGMTGT
jgi:preprotein translocase subunit SecE